MEDEIFIPNVPRVSVRQHVSNEYMIRLTRDITEPDHFYEEFQCLASAGEHDIIHMDIVSPGGSLDTCVMLRRAMARCQANIIGWIGPTCASAATAIALQCDGWEVDEMSAFMIHTGSFGVPRNTARNVESAAKHSKEQIESFIRLVYTGFLSEEEIDKVLDGKELYFVGEELASRLEAYGKYRDNLSQELDDEQETE